MKKKLFICGGHVTPAIAVIDELTDDFDIVFLGRTSAVEHTLMKEKGIRFLPMRKIPIGFLQACWYCLREKPDCIVSFGGYVALPVAIAGWILGIPVITHEQTLVPGRANRIIAKIARRVCVTFPETQKQFPSSVITGLPMRKELFVSSEYKSPRPLLYITGGSQGAKSLNERIMPAIEILRKQFMIIHQTGPATFISASRLAGILQHAKIIIGRSGANTTMELAALGCVAIFVPLPWSAGGEQLAQARWLAARGSAVVIEQNMLTKERLLNTVHMIVNSYDGYKKAAEKLARNIPRNGAKCIADEIRSLV